MYTNAYIIGILFFIPLWIFFFSRRSDLRRPMIIIGVYVGCLAILTDFVWFLKDYWYPIKHIAWYNLIWQDFLLGFFLGGILSVAFEQFFHTKVKEFKLDIRRALLILFIIIFPLFIFTSIFGINSIYSSMIGLSASIILILCTDRSLLFNSLSSGFLSLILAIIGYFLYLIIYPNIFSVWWMLDNLSGIFIFKIPIEELLWFISFGMITGSLYKYLYRE